MQFTELSSESYNMIIKNHRIDDLSFIYTTSLLFKLHIDYALGKALRVLGFVRRNPGCVMSACFASLSVSNSFNRRTRSVVWFIF